MCHVAWALRLVIDAQSAAAIPCTNNEAALGHSGNNQNPLCVSRKLCGRRIIYEKLIQSVLRAVSMRCASFAEFYEVQDTVSIRQKPAVKTFLVWKSASMISP